MSRPELLFVFATLDLMCLAAIVFNYLTHHPYDAFFNPGQVKHLYWKKQRKVSLIMVAPLCATIILIWVR